MKYRIKKDIIIEGQLVKSGSTITINEVESDQSITWGEVKQIFNAISKSSDKSTLGNTMKTIGKVGLKIGLGAFGLGVVAEAIEAVGNINDIKSAGKALFKVSSTISKMELNDPNNSKFKELTGPFWRAVKLSPELSQILDDKIELAFINEVILPKIQQTGNDNDVIPNMDLELGRWLNDKGLKTRAGVHFKGRQDLVENIDKKKDLIIELNETVYGNYATIYHRTSDINNFIFGTNENGITFGTGDAYGSGFYANYDFKSSMTDYSKRIYGNYVLKFLVKLDNILILTLDAMFKRYNKYISIINQLKNINIKLSDSQWNQIRVISDKLEKLYNDDLYPEFQGSEAQNLIDILRIKNLSHKIMLNNFKGLIYNGRKDNNTIVIFDTNIIAKMIGYYSIDDNYTKLNSIEHLRYNNKNFVKKNYTTSSNTTLSSKLTFDDIIDDFSSNPIQSIIKYFIKLEIVPIISNLQVGTKYIKNISIQDVYHVRQIIESLFRKARHYDIINNWNLVSSYIGNKYLPISILNKLMRDSLDSDTTLGVVSDYIKNDVDLDTNMMKLLDKYKIDLKVDVIVENIFENSPYYSLLYEKNVTHKFDIDSYLSRIMIFNLRDIINGLSSITIDTDQVFDIDMVDIFETEGEMFSEILRYNINYQIFLRLFYIINYISKIKKYSIVDEFILECNNIKGEDIMRNIKDSRLIYNLDGKLISLNRAWKISSLTNMVDVIFKNNSSIFNNIYSEIYDRLNTNSSKIDETVSGNYLIGYHRTRNAKRFIEGTNKMGIIVNPNSINWHGFGFYMTDDIESSLNYGDEYGDNLFKCYVKSDKILHLSKKNRMKAFGKDLTLVEQLVKFGIKLDDYQIRELNDIESTIEKTSDHYPIFENIRRLLFKHDSTTWYPFKVPTIGLDGVTLTDSHDGNVIVIFNLIGTIVVDGYWRIDSGQIIQSYNKIDHKMYNVKNIVNPVVPKSLELSNNLNNNSFTIFTKYNTTEKLSKLIGKNIEHLYDLPNVSGIDYIDNIEQLNKIGIYVPYSIRTYLNTLLPTFNAQLQRLLTPNIMIDFINEFEPYINFKIIDNRYRLVINHSIYSRIWDFMKKHWTIIFYDLIEKDNVIEYEVGELVNEILDNYELLKPHTINNSYNLKDFINKYSKDNYYRNQLKIFNLLNEKIFNKLKSLV